MNTSTFAKFAVSTLAVGSSLSVGGIAFAPAHAVTAAAQATTLKQAETLASAATATLANPTGRKVRAIAYAEKAVALVPTSAPYRLLLGRAYLANGRFTSAETAFKDALSLDPSNAKSALNYALTMIARGDQAGALSTLAEYREQITPADYGLAVALAGDIASGLEILTDAVRAPDASAKSRQNLGFVFALAGRWIEARTLAAQDLSPDLVNQRMTQWASLAHPTAAWDQVAGLMNVKPAGDPGLPTLLALNGVSAPRLASGAPEMVPAKAEAIQLYVAENQVFKPEFELPAEKAVTVALEAPVKLIVAPAKPAEQAQLIRAESSMVKQLIVPLSMKAASTISASDTRPHRVVQGGRFAVQLGAYRNARMAEYAWGQSTSKIADLRGYDPSSARVIVKSAAFYRLSVSGFATRDVAGQVCAKVRSAGGQCFVRSISGDKPMQFASRGGGTKRVARR